MNTPNPSNYDAAEQEQINAGINLIGNMLGTIATSNAVRLEILADVAARIVAVVGSEEDRKGLVNALARNIALDAEQYAACDCPACQAQRAEREQAEQAAAKEASDVIAAVSQPRNLH